MAAERRGEWSHETVTSRPRPNIAYRRVDVCGVGARGTAAWHVAQGRGSHTVSFQSAAEQAAHELDARKVLGLQSTALNYNLRQLLEQRLDDNSTGCASAERMERRKIQKSLTFSGSCTGEQVRRARNSIRTFGRFARIFSMRTGLPSRDARATVLRKI